MSSSENPYGDRVDNINAQQVDGASLSDDNTLGGSSASSALFPTQKAVRDYIQAVLVGDIPINHHALENLEFFASGHEGFQRACIVVGSAPGINQDTSQGYVVGDIWLNTVDSRLYMAKDITVGAAVWEEVLTINSDYYTQAEVQAEGTALAIKYAIALG